MTGFIAWLGTALAMLFCVLAIFNIAIETWEGFTNHDGRDDQWYGGE
jgi:uncharacterized membrane protein YidH (DUF202 family)